MILFNMEFLTQFESSYQFANNAAVFFLLTFSYINRNTIFPKSFLRVSHFVWVLIEDFGLCTFTTAWMLAFGLGYSACFAWKIFLHIYMKLKYGPLGDTLDCLDAVGIIENENSSLNITSLKVLEGHCDLEEFRRRVAATVGKKNGAGKLVYTKFYQYLDQVTGYCCWKPSRFDINHHVRYFDGLDESSPSLSESEVLEKISQFADSAFEVQRSPWEVLIIPKLHYAHETQVINPKPKFGAVIRIHHGIGDGYSFLKLIIRDTTLPGDETVNCPVPQAPSRPNMPLWKGALVFLYLTLRSARSFYTQIISRDNNPLFCSGRKISGKKILVWSQPISVHFLKEVKTKLGVGLSTTFLTALTSTVRKYIVEEFGESPKSLSAVIPMPAPNHPDSKMTNKFSFIKFQLPGDESDPVKALKMVDQEGMRLSRAPDAPMNLFLLRLMGVLPTRFIREFLRNKHSTIVISNLPGPSQNISIWGSQLLETMFWLPSLGISGISFSCLSYKSNFRLGLTIDTGIIQDGHTGAMRLIDGFTEAILSLAHSANVSIENAFPQFATPSPKLPNSGSSESLYDCLSESDAETSGHYSFTSSDAEDEEPHKITLSLFRPQRKRSLSSSSILPRISPISILEYENKTLFRCNSANSLNSYAKFSLLSKPTACA